MSVPLSLSYHASGVRVADVASWVGLGWSLNAGGVITRVVRGMPDEEVEGGFHKNYNKVPFSGSFNPRDSNGVANYDYYRLSRITQHLIDYEPDLYSYNFGGQAGNFMMGNDGEFHAFPLQPLHIAVEDTSITLTDAQGNRYLFADREYSAVQPRTREKHISAWYLTRVVSANRADTIAFAYQRATGTSIYSISQQVSIVSRITTVYDGGDNGLSRPPGDDYKDHEVSIAHVQTKRLSSIKFRGGVVRFSTQGGRLDGTGEVQLQAFCVTSPNGQDTLKKVCLYQSYFNQDQAQSADASNILRLRLDSVATAGAGRDEAEPPYRFTYSPVPLPNRVTGARDYWGYTTGASQRYSINGNPWLLPLTTVQSLAAHGPIQLDGSNRRPNPAQVQAALLTGIRYPTGGTQQFTFEPNTVPESYRVPNPRTKQQVTAQTPLSGDSTVIVSSRFQVPHPVTRIICEVHASRQSPADGHAAPPKSSTYFALRDITTSTTPFSWQTQSSSTSPTGGTNPSTTYFTKIDSLSVPTLNPAHTYELYARAEGLASGTLTVSYQDPGVTYATRTAIVGGVRLRQERLQASAQAPATIRRYYYQLAGSTASSGLLVNEAAPLYQRTQVSRVEGPGDPNCNDQYTTLCARKSIIDITYTIVGSNSLGELEGSDQTVSYTRVAVVDSSTTGQTAGRTVSTYSYASESATNETPFPAKALVSWKRGNLLQQSKYAATAGGQEQLLTKLVNTYTTLDSLTFQGLTAAVSSPIALGALFSQDGAVRPFAYLNTRQTSGWQHITKSQQYLYAAGDTSSYHLTTTRYQYGSTVHCQPTLVETDSPGGQYQQVRSRYAADYDTISLSSQSTGPARALRELQRTHAVAQLVEQTTTRTTATDTVVTHSQLILSRVLAPGVVVPARQLGLRTAVPPSWQNFQASRLRSGNLTWDTRYESQVVFDGYDAQRQLVQAHLPSGTPLSYLWETRSGQPLAKATNATVAQVAATSFEPGATGRWRYDSAGTHQIVGGHTGRYAYLLNRTAPVWRDQLPAGDYEFTGWVQSNGAPQFDLRLTGGTTLGGALQLAATPGSWYQYRMRVRFTTTGQLSLDVAAGSPTVALDELRLCPVGAQLSTYTYDPLRGMTSQTGPDGRTLLYEYDGLGRLVRTRDEQGRVLGQQQYHYAGQ